MSNGQQPAPWGGPQGFAAAWGVLQHSWNVAVQQRVQNLQNLSAAIRSVGRGTLV